MINFFLTRMLLKRVLRKRRTTRLATYMPLTAATDIGLLVNAGDCRAAEAFQFLRFEFKRMGIRCSYVCADMRKEPESAPIFSAVPGIIRIDRRNVNWYGVPDPDATSEFLKTKFDILIDISSASRLFPLDYLLYCADAKLRIGVAPGPDNIYDITVWENREDGSPVPADLLARNIVKYLTTIK